MDDPFADIRPYRDDEVAGVLARLTEDPEFIGAVARFRLGRWASVFPGLVRKVVRSRLTRQLRDVRGVEDMQMVIKQYIEKMITQTTSGFSVSGLDQLDPGRPYLFMSNHRDIAMDPAFTNYALHTHGHRTLRIAIGDNLLTMPWVSDLMRLNKSFLVKRSVSGPRELLANSRHLSAYIRHSLQEEREPVWIAQREGRAKDGRDRTEPAVIKMLSMSRDKRSESFADHIALLGIVPVAISYELDPCDALKARELHQLATSGTYTKAAQEDVASIGRGISGDKGHVHVSFGRPLGADLGSADEVATEIDRQIIELYTLHPTNVFAWQMLNDDAPFPESLRREPGTCSRAAFTAHIAALPAAHRPFALAIYANAVVSKLELAA